MKTATFRHSDFPDVKITISGKNDKEIVYRLAKVTKMIVDWEVHDVALSADELPPSLTQQASL